MEVWDFYFYYYYAFLTDPVGSVVQNFIFRTIFNKES